MNKIIREPLTKFSKQESELFDEVFDAEQEVLDLLEKFINAEWDSNTLKSKIKVLMKHRERLFNELAKIDTED